MGEVQAKFYRVKKVLSVMFHHKKQRHTYSVLWEQKKRKKPWITPVFLEDLMTCPHLVVDYEERKYEKLKKKMEDAGIPCKIRKKSVSVSLRNTVLARPDEYLPSGKEILKKILFRSKERVMDEVLEFYHVKFRRTSGVKKLRLAVMEYYFPVDLLIYWNENEFEFN